MLQGDPERVAQERDQDMRFDVPVVGLRTIEVMQCTGATCLALDAGKCLLLEGEQVITAANNAGIAIVAV